MDWFLACLGRATQGAQTLLGRALARARLAESIAHAALNARQRQIVNRGLEGLEGNLTTSKYAKLTLPGAPRSATFSSLVASGVLVGNPQGRRSASYMPARRD